MTYLKLDEHLLEFQTLIKYHSGQVRYVFEMAKTKEGCVLPMEAVSMPPLVEVGPNDHREDAPHFISIHHENHKKRIEFGRRVKIF